LGSITLDTASAWIAQDKRFFRETRTQRHYLRVPGWAKSIAAIASGEVRISLNSGIEVINARSQDIPLQSGLVNKFSFDFVVAQNHHQSVAASGD
jgi:hypothetical protein